MATIREVIFPNSLEILTGIRVVVGMCWGTLVAAEFLAGTTGIGFVENVARKYMQYEVIWITIFVMGMLGLLFDVTIRKIIDKTIPWRGKGKLEDLKYLNENQNYCIIVFINNFP